MALKYSPTCVHYYIEAKIAVLRSQLTWLFGGISFFAGLALFYCFMNVDFANAQRDDTPVFSLLREKPLAAAVCLFRLCSNDWARGKKIQRTDFCDHPTAQGGQ
jgi:hypothetical protein